MKTLQEIKDELAVKCGFESWNKIVLSSDPNTKYSVNMLSDMIAKRYAEEALKEATEKVHLGYLSNIRKQDAKQSILSLINELK